MPPISPAWLISMLFYLRGMLQPNVMASDWKTSKWHTPAKLYSTHEINRLASFDQNKIDNFDTTLDNILIVRPPNSEGHEQVRQFIKDSMASLNFEVTEDVFDDLTPDNRLVRFSNIVATHNPNACKRLLLACHYDSLTKDGFVGAIDSAVPCAMMIELARNLLPKLNEHKNDDITLQLVFFDGEEAFKQWSDTDSLYGSRHLAKKWNRTKVQGSSQLRSRCASKGIISELDRIDVFVLLDLIGTRNPHFYSFYSNTHSLFGRFIQIEEKLNALGLLQTDSVSQTKYFQSRMYPGGIISDDHVPFVQQDVPVVHLITLPFPKVWHTVNDNRAALHKPTIINLMKIFQIFVSSYLHL